MERKETESCAIYLLCGRPHFLEVCLNSLWENYNQRFGYPVFVYYFDNLLSAGFRRQVSQRSQAPLTFISRKTAIPQHISESDLFYNRRNTYARNFGRERLNYLHMEHFVSNLLELSELKEFDYIHRIDDDSLLLKDLPRNLTAELRDLDKVLGTSHTYNEVSERHLHTREGLFAFVKAYVARHNLFVANTKLRMALETDHEAGMHSLEWSSGNFNIYNMKHFRNSDFEQWIEAVNQIGGPYKYRWGDQEILGLFGYLYKPDPVLNFELVSNGYYNPRRDGTTIIRKRRLNFLSRGTK